MQLLTLSKLILATSLLVPSLVFADKVGGISEHKGSGGITRQNGEVVLTALDVSIQPMDHVETANGRLKIDFLDTSEVRLTENTEITIYDYYYDKATNDGGLKMKMVSGTARFTTGRLGLIPKENIVIDTPTATVQVRGTDFTTSIDELGRSLVILLPETECTIDGDCSPSGEITVINAGGTVTLTEAYQATMVSSYDQRPAQPVRLDNINLNMIDNMFIVNPPREINEQKEEQSQARSNDAGGILDFNELDTDYLEGDYLADDDLEFTELDMDLLDVDFLQDVLVAIEEVDILKRGTRSAQGNNEFTGTSLGFDKETQYNSIIDQGAGQIWFYRDVNGVISARIPIGSNTTLESTNEGKRNVITVGDGQSVVIIINQSG
mgnify:FL=1|jgi:hypothetical protein|tara:strand:+ start:4412 stop:5551 length:1140 start_codon:yes stop_codon:yes gene_type:complete